MLNLKKYKQNNMFNIKSIFGIGAALCLNISVTSGDANLSGGMHSDVACNFLSWPDGAAFADWAGLQPMSELEFEKACRGSLNPVNGEFAWGTTNITGAAGISNSGANNEVSSNSRAHVVYGYDADVLGPLRVGSFATVSSIREQAGVSDYGIMELSGNLWEQAVSVGNTSGRNFTGSIHGDGLLTTDGFCNISTWPGFVSDNVTGAAGIGFRGGAWSDNAFSLRVSSRIFESYILSDRGKEIVRSVQ